MSSSGSRVRLGFGVEVDTGAKWMDAGPGADKGREEGVEVMREGVVGNGGSTVGDGLATANGVLLGRSAGTVGCFGSCGGCLGNREGAACLTCTVGGNVVTGVLVRGAITVR